jgi:hypothetical protein
MTQQPGEEILDRPFLGVGWKSKVISVAANVSNRTATQECSIRREETRQLITQVSTASQRPWSRPASTAIVPSGPDLSRWAIFSPLNAMGSLGASPVATTLRPSPIIASYRRYITEVL